MFGGVWSKSIPNVAAGQYLWTRTVVTYTDGTNSISYSVGRMGQNGSNGSPGADGSDGRGIASYAITYQASNSQTTAPTGTWSSSVPKLSTELPYLWTRTVFTYTDGSSSTSYSVSSTLDAFEVGGRNLLLDTANPAEHFKVTLQYETVTIEAEEMLGVMGATAIVTETPTGWRYSQYSFGASRMDLIQPSTQYTLSFDVYSSVGGSIKWQLMNSTATNPACDESNTISIPANEWIHAVMTVMTYDTIDVSDQVIYIHGLFTLPGTHKVCNFKLEKGNKATDWTPAPEDVDSNIQDAKDAANNAQNDVNALGPRVDKAEVSIETLADGIANLVVGSDGSTLMTQTEDGWQFNFGAFQENLENALTSIDAVEGDVSEAQAAINSAQGVIDGLVEKTSYINMGQDSSGAPYIELGKYNNDFKLRITNTSVDFMDGTTRVAYVSNQALYIERAVIKNELKIGDGAGFVWRTRSNGNMGLRWEAN